MFKTIISTVLLLMANIVFAQTTQETNKEASRIVCLPEGGKIICKNMKVTASSTPTAPLPSASELMQGNVRAYNQELGSIPRAPQATGTVNNTSTANSNTHSSHPPMSATCPVPGTISPNGYPIDTFSPVDGSRFTCNIYTGGMMQDIYGFITPEKNPELFAFALKVFGESGFAQWKREIAGKKFKADPNSISWGVPSSGKPMGDVTLFSYLFSSSSGF